MPDPLTIVRLSAENLKRIVAVEVAPDPDDGLVIVSGRNGQGKTSLLDSIALALGGGRAGRETTLPIREGEARASVEIDFGDFVVTKTWERDKTPKLVVTSPEGANYKSPQSFLDDRLGALSFDPLAFTRKSPKDQLADLLDLVELPFDPLVLAAEREVIFGQRTEVNRSVRNMEGELAGYGREVDEAPDELVSTSEVLDQVAAAEAQARANADALARLEREREQLRQARERVERLEGELAAARDGVVVLFETVERLAAEAEDLPDVPDVAVFHERLAGAEEVNERVRRKREKGELAARCSHAMEVADSLTAQLDQIDARKALALAEAQMPVEGLAFDDSGVTYNGIPFAQCSGAEQLRVSTAMAMALNPSIGVIRITDGSLLDAENLAVLREMARDRHFQVWIERVSDEGGVGFEIVDGSLA